MFTKLIQFTNPDKKILRGIYSGAEENKKLVIMASGLERKATTEKKFTALSKALNQQGIDCFRFDYEGLGLSEGDFSDFTVENWKKDLLSARAEMEGVKKYDSISLVAHSVSGCVAALAREEADWEKMVLLGPALNQKDLLRYYFAQNKMKKEDPRLEVTWENFRDYFREEDFQAYIKEEGKMTKENYILPDYFLQNEDKDYSSYFQDTDNVLLVQGDNDKKVPPESFNIDFSRKITVSGGDHDMERPDLLEQWLSGSVKFLI